MGLQDVPAAKRGHHHAAEIGKRIMLTATVIAKEEQSLAKPVSSYDRQEHGKMVHKVDAQTGRAPR